MLAPGLGQLPIKTFGPGEIMEAIDAAATVGDDNIQQRSTGTITPETWTHGSSEQRKSAFLQGYENPDNPNIYY